MSEEFDEFTVLGMSLDEAQFRKLKRDEVFVVIWVVPNDELRLFRVYEVYTGLDDQLRVGFADKHGRVFHYDASDVLIAII